MTTSEICPQEVFNVYWKIKNFAYCCETIRSPEFEFSYSQYQYYIELDIQPGFGGGQARFYRKAVNWRIVDWKHEISLLTCDGSPELPISGSHNLKDVIFGQRRSALLPEDTLTLRLRAPGGKEELFISSQIGVNRKCFLWTLSNFSQNTFSTHKTVEVSKLYGNIGLHLKSMSDGNHPPEQYSIEMTRSGGERCYCVLKISLMDVDGRVVKESRGDFIFEKQNQSQTRGFPFLIDKHYVLACKNLLLHNNTLTLKCYFAVSLGKVSGGASVMSYCENAAILTKEAERFMRNFHEESDLGGVSNELQTRLKSLLEEEVLCDVSLQVGLDVIRAHKSILCARSPVFRAMFTKDMAEASNNTVIIEDLDAETVRSFLLYMYSDILVADWGTMKDLYSAADKYEVLSLKEKCASFLKAKLSIFNVCEAFVIADLHQDRDFKAAVLDFISENDSGVFESQDWKEVERDHSSVALQIMRELYSYRKRIKRN